MRENSGSLSIFLRPKSIIYRLFSHRYILVVVIVATSQMGLQLWFEGRALVVNVSETPGRLLILTQQLLVFGLKRQGVGLLHSILETSNQPHGANWNSPTKRSLHNESVSLQPQLVASRPTGRVLVEPLLSQNDSQKKGAIPPKNTTARPHKTHATQRLKVEKKPPDNKSTQTRLQDADPEAIQILQVLNGQNGGTTGPTPTTNLAAPGAAVFLLDGNLINLSAKCVNALSGIVNYVNRGHPTAIARIVFQIWLWGLTIWGLLLESTPHIGAVAASHVLNTSFLVFNLQTLINLKQDFENVVSNDCDGVDVLPSFWQFLLQLGIVAVVFSAITVLAFAILGFKLYSVLDWRTFKKLGASRIVRMAHTFSLIFAAIVQLNAYFVVVFLALWLNEVLRHPWTPSSSQNIQNTTAFKATLGTFLGLSIPWLMVGNSSLKKERIIGIIAFLVFDVALLTFTIFLLCQQFYKKMARCWIFLRFIGIMACILMFSSLLIAAACLLVFDRGLLSKVNRESNETYESHERPNMSDDEVAFPGNDVKPYSYQTNDTSSSIPQPSSVLAPGMNYSHHSQNYSSESQPKHQHSFTGAGNDHGTHSSLRPSWREGDEVKWIAPTVNKPRRQSNWSIPSRSSDEFSYATTTMTESTSDSQRKK